LKTQIITLEAHDDLISVRDKLSWAKTPRILLVWPKHEKVTLRILDLKVLQRHADSLGAQVGIVTRQMRVRRDAESLGIPVFESTTTAQRDAWPVQEPRTRRIPKAPRRDLRKFRDFVYEKEAPWRSSLLGRVLTFSAGVLAVLAVAGLFVPRAALTLYPQAQTQSLVIPVAASESVRSVSVTGAIPAHVISVIVNAEQTLAIVSQISVAKSKAKGIARFTNLGQSEVNIPAGTLVSAGSSIRFVTLHDTLLPGGVDEFVDIPVEAQEAGAKGNIAENIITLVDGPIGLSATVTNPDPISGGADAKVTGATDDDRSKLSGVVFDNLSRSALEQMRSQIKADDLLLADTLESDDILQEEFDPPAGAAGKSLLLKMKVKFSARYISADELDQLSISTLTASIPAGFSAFGKVKLNPLAAPVTDESGVTHFDLEVKQDLLKNIDQTQVFALMHGNSLERARAELFSGLALRKDPQIVLSPAWWPWLPLIPFDVSIEIK
jgi:Baseplate J-like protein